jgi:hypothetical protein
LFAIYEARFRRSFVLSSCQNGVVQGLKNQNQMNTPMKQNAKPESKRAKRLRLINEFAGHMAGAPNVSVAAEQAGISRSQATRWLRSEVFLDAFRELHRPTNEAIESLARSLVIPSLKAAGRIVNDPESPATAVVQALKTIASLNLIYGDRNGLEDDVERIISEKAAEEQADE